jgi:hypothetical protein
MTCNFVASAKIFSKLFALLYKSVYACDPSLIWLERFPFKKKKSKSLSTEKSTRLVQKIKINKSAFNCPKSLKIAKMYF